MDRRPNVRLVIADQLAAQFLPVHGHPVVKAPAVEQLADDAVVFTSAHTPSPLCAPSRFAMVRGQRNSRIGADDNGSELPASVPTFAHHLRARQRQPVLRNHLDLNAVEVARRFPRPGVLVSARP